MKTNKKETKRNNWLSEIPTQCDLCHKPIKVTFIDGKTKLGPWVLMCEKCHKKYGCGLGIGEGQKYEAVTGRFLEG